MIDKLYLTFRLLAKQPAYVFGVAVSLAVGVGLTTGIYNVLEYSLLRPMPGGESERVFVLRSDNTSSMMSDHGLNGAILADLMSQKDLYEEIVWYDSTTLKLERDGFLDVIYGPLCQATFFIFGKSNRSLAGHSVVMTAKTITSNAWCCLSHSGKLSLVGIIK